VSLSLLVKLGSLMVHTDEYLSEHGHPFDKIAIRQVLDDPEVKAWREEMDVLAMLPVPRHKAGG
jgi:hypothetical protein